MTKTYAQRRASAYNLEAAIRNKKNKSWKKLSLYHWRKIINGENFDYWPSTKLFRYKGQSYAGDPNLFIESLLTDGLYAQKQIKLKSCDVKGGE